jgi:hypothetical protein
MRRSIINLVGAALLWSAVSSGQGVVDVEFGAVHLGQVWPAAPAELADLEIGNAPPPGSSRLLQRSDLIRSLGQQGANTKALDLPLSVRIRTRSETWSFRQLEEACESKLRVRPGIELVRVKARGAVTVPRGTLAGAPELGQLPRRVGEVTVLGMLPLSYAGQIVQRVPVSFVFDVSPAGAAPAVAKGAVLQVVVSTGSAQISALAEALSDADVGDTVQVRVNSTRRVVQAVIESSDRARVVAR